MRFVSLEALLETGGEEPFYDDWDEQILRLDWERALASLSAEERAVVMLHLEEGKSARAIARIQRRRIAEVEAMLQQALEKLRHALR